MIAVPQSEITKKVMGPISSVLALSLVHLCIVLLAASAPGGTEVNEMDRGEAQGASLESLPRRVPTAFTARTAPSLDRFAPP